MSTSMPAALRIVARTIKRRPIYAVTSVSGLLVGMASFVLIGLFLREEWRFDRFHEHADRIASAMNETL